MDFNNFLINQSDFKLIKEIGSGTYGLVYLAVNINNEKQYAAKIIKAQDNFDSHEQILFLRESLILYKLQYPSILKFEGVSFQSLTDNQQFNPTIMTEYLPNQSLRYNLEKNSAFTSTKKYITLLGISDAMRYLHKHGIIHRDLKPDNILFDENYFPRVCDFGISRCFTKSLTNSMSFIMTSGRGTPLYMAPEIIEEEKYSSAVDVYSFGIIAYEIVNKKKPYSEIKQKGMIKLLQKVAKGNRPTFSGNETEKMKKLITRCWSQNVSERPSFDEIFKELSTDFSYFRDEIDHEAVNSYIDYLKSERIKIERKEKEKGDSGLFVESFDDDDDDDDDDKDDDSDDEVDSGDVKFVKKAVYKDNHNLSYELYENKKIAKIIDSPDVEGDVFIPAVVKFSSVKYKVKEISENAFANSSIETISFAANSFINSIEDFAFENSKIRKICFPKSLTKLGKCWCKGAKDLTEIEIHPENTYFSIKNGFLVHDDVNEYEIIFPSETNNLNDVIIEQEKRLLLNDYCFSNSKNLSTLKISCSELETSSNSFVRCPSFKKFEIHKSTAVKLNSNTFKKCINLETISFNDSIKISIEKDHFISSKNNLKSILFNKVQEVVIHKNAFSEFNSLQNLTFSNIGKIEFYENCFHNCQSLSSLLLICNKDILINEDTFSGCISLKEIKIKTKSQLLIPNNFMLDSKQLEKVILKGQKIKIGDYCFKNCTSLKSFIIKESGAISIGDYEFVNCTSLSKISIESTQKSVKFGKNCFSGAINMIDFNLECNEVVLNNDCFKSCKSLQNLFILKTSKISIDDDQLVGLESLLNVVINSDSEISIGENCFSESCKLKSVSLQAEKISIHSNCFSMNSINQLNDYNSFKIALIAPEVELCKDCFHNSNIEVIAINGKKATLFNECFSACSLFNTLKLNDEVTTLNLGQKVFCDCKKFDTFDVNIPELTLNADNECFVDSSIHSFSFKGKKAKFGENSFKSLSSIESLHISSDKINLGNGSFENCVNLQTIYLECKLKLVIGDACFSGLKNLKDLKLEGSGIEIGKYCFTNCSSLEKIDFNFNKMLISEKAFEGCNCLKSVTIMVKTKFHAGPNCFSNLSKLNEVKISSEEITIDDSCFANCSSLDSIQFLNSNKLTFGEKVFEYCNNIKTFEVEVLNEFHAGSNCFSKLTKLNEIKIKCEEITFGDSCFANCSSLNSILFLNSNKLTFGEKVFEYCNSINLFEVEVLNEFHAGPYCFSNSSKLNEVKITSEEITIDDSCFANCSSLDSIQFLNSNKLTFGEKVFEYCNNIKTFEVEVLNEFHAGPNCFSKLTKLNEIKIKCEEITIDNYCFANCSSLDSILFLNSNKLTFGEKVFEHCNSIKAFKVEASNEFHAGPNCFSNLASLEVVQITSKNITIDDFCFSGCSSLNSFSLLEAHQVNLGVKILEYCNNITILALDAVIEFCTGPNCFSNLNALKMAQITGEKVTIESSCFANCPLLYNFSILKAKQAFLKERAFEKCEKLDTVDIEASEYFEGSQFCFSSKIKKFKEFSIGSQEIHILRQCFELCPHLKQVNCQSANRIIYFDNEFNKIAPNEFFKCKTTTTLQKMP